MGGSGSGSGSGADAGAGAAGTIGPPTSNVSSASTPPAPATEKAPCTPAASPASPASAAPAALPTLNAVTSHANASVTVPRGASPSTRVNVQASTGARKIPASSGSTAITGIGGAHMSGRY